MFYRSDQSDDEDEKWKHHCEIGFSKEIANHGVGGMELECSSLTDEDEEADECQDKILHYLPTIIQLYLTHTHNITYNIHNNIDHKIQQQVTQ